MKRLYIPGMMNVFHVSDPKEINALSNDPNIDRHFVTKTCPFNWFLLKRSLSVLSIGNRRFPTMSPRRCPARMRHQDALWRELSKQAPRISTGPAELSSIATWVQGIGAEEEIGILAQQLLGRLFIDDFTATTETWNAAKILVAAPRSPNMLRVLWWFVTGKIARAKHLLAVAVNNDLSAVNAIGIAVHNFVKSLHQMRTLYADVGIRTTLSAQSAAAGCLFAPTSVYRQAISAGKLGENPFSKHSLFVFEIGTASQMPDGRDLVFMENTWSRCPASVWIPSALEGIWRKANSM